MLCVARSVSETSLSALQQAGTPALLARLFAARGIDTVDQLDDSLQKLLPPESLRGCLEAAHALADAIENREPLCIVADYDCDGATACALGVRGLQLMGAQQVMTLVPDRVADGYGLTPAIAQRVHAMGARWLITVDNGIASVEGVQVAQQLGLKVLVTDHHLPGDTLPQAEVIVNPNHPQCTFDSKALAGVGVMFYVIMALRAEGRKRGWFDATTQPRLDILLPLVALGTVADVAKLDLNNRRLVQQGLLRMRKGIMPMGMRALFEVAQRNPARATTQDLGFSVGPRLNAAGRLSDMSLGIACLLTDDDAQARRLAQQLDHINRERRQLEGGMRDTALAIAQDLMEQSDGSLPALTLFDPEFHEGVIGIVAGRIKEQLHRPAFVFAMSAGDPTGDTLKGSGRSIAGFHLRDALDLMSKRHPGLMERFGGHAMAAGCTLHADHLDTFEQALAQVASEWMEPAQLQRMVVHDGSLPHDACNLQTAAALAEVPWGHGFEAPLFCDTLRIGKQRIVGEKHLAFQVQHHNQTLDAIYFQRIEPLPEHSTLVYQLDVSEWQGQQRLQLKVHACAD